MKVTTNFKKVHLLQFAAPDRRFLADSLFSMVSIWVFRTDQDVQSIGKEKFDFKRCPLSDNERFGPFESFDCQERQRNDAEKLI